ncbi:hypothetical protein E2562_006687 [Oryza meyeriana var. granulata]|uniref:Uncharacterized protein n=1 Tax=Oryza meyeriana var. granulata TaxID=110450 RepID=A0A6G1EF57_9ORYZ|nr:hypothetical protein E2562_006687 [Oryza meyeriana var. granulata]
MKRLSRLYDRFLEQIIQKHEVGKAAAGDDGRSAAACDLVDVLLHISEEDGGADSEARLTRDGAPLIAVAEPRLPAHLYAAAA